MERTQEQLAECTFAPKVNKRGPAPASNRSVLDSTAASRGWRQLGNRPRTSSFRSSASSAVDGLLPNRGRGGPAAMAAAIAASEAQADSGSEDDASGEASPARTSSPATPRRLADPVSTPTGAGSQGDETATGRRADDTQREERSQSPIKSRSAADWLETMVGRAMMRDPWESAVRLNAQTAASACCVPQPASHRVQTTDKEPDDEGVAAAARVRKPGAGVKVVRSKPAFRVVGYQETVQRMRDATQVRPVAPTCRTLLGRS